MFELREAVNKGGAPLLYQGIVACAFNDLQQCQKKLGSVIKAAPLSKDARQARTTLAAVYFRSGRYREALSQADAMLAVTPDDPVKGPRPLLAALAVLPGQSVTRRGPSKVPVRAWGEDLAIAVTVNGHPATYGFDTGSFAAMVSLSEARRLGLKIHDTDRDARVNGLSIQVASADDFQVGGFRFRNVAFIVFPDNEEPFSDMPEGERGIIGLPTLLAFRNFSWRSDGVFEFGLRNSSKVVGPNISFDEQYVVVRVEYGNSRLTMGLDTGGETSTLDRRFAETFTDVVKASGRKDSKTLNEIGSSRKIDSIVLPEVELRVGGFPTSLRPAHILTDGPPPGCHYGDIGMDLMQQSHRTKIDFDSMTITMN
jgi:hypothetical protein